MFAELGGAKNSICSVATEKSYPQTWLVDAKDIEFVRGVKSRKEKLVEKIEGIINKHSPMDTFEVKENCAKEIAELFY